MTKVTTLEKLQSAIEAENAAHLAPIKMTGPAEKEFTRCYRIACRALATHNSKSENKVRLATNFSNGHRSIKFV